MIGIGENEPIGPAKCSPLQFFRSSAPIALPSPRILANWIRVTLGLVAEEMRVFFLKAWLAFAPPTC